MRYLVWILRLAIFIVVLLFALKNTAPVDVGLFGGHVLEQIPLIVVMLTAFILGMAFGLLMAVLALLRRRRELNRLRRELARARRAPDPSPGQDASAAPETMAPLAPL